MKNKKQFHLRTIQIDQFFNFTTQCSTDASHSFHKKNSLMRASSIKRKQKKQIKSYYQDEKEVNYQRYVKKKIGLFQNFGNLQINRKSLGQFLSSNLPIKSSDQYQLFNKRTSLIKNRKAFHQIINTGKMFTEDVNRQQQQFQGKLSQILIKKPQKIQKSVKIRSKTEASTKINKKPVTSYQRTRPKSMSMNKLFSSKKVDQNNPEPWEISVQDDSNFYLTYL